MRALSVCDGIGAALVAMPHWDWVAVSEIEPFPCAVHAFHHPDIPNWGDMTKYEEWPDEAIGILVGGTPCQAFSVAGLRQGLSDPRGNLTLTFVGVVEKYKPRWVLWENVPGVLGDRGGAFYQFVSALTEIGYSVAWRVLDARHFGVPQRRRRVWVLARRDDSFPGSGAGAVAAALFPQSEGEGRDSAESGEAREGATRDAEGCAGVLAAATGRSGYKLSGEAEALWACGHKQSDTDLVVGAGGVSIWPDAAMPLMSRDAKGPRNYYNDGLQGCVCYENHAQDNRGYCAALAPSVTQSGPPFSRTGNQRVECDALVSTAFQVRRLTCREAERLQGFPDDFTRIPWRGKSAEGCPDGPRYKALGNSWAVPCAAWVMRRIELSEGMCGV